MKKISKALGKFFKSIGKFFDKVLITPIMKLVLSLNDFFSGNNKVLENLLYSKKILLILSLLLAFLAFYKLDENSSLLLNNSAERLYNQPINALYNEEAYVIEGLPESADIIIYGKSSYVALAKQYPSNGITVDLRDLGPGTHKVNLKYEQYFSFVEYSVDPGYITVVISDKVSAIKEADYEVLHKEILDSKLDVSSVSLSQTDITVKSSKETLAKVAYVKALVDVNLISNPTSGVKTVKGCKLVAFDSDGQPMNVQILPETVDAEVALVTSSKTVPVRVIPEGKESLPNGKAIGDLTPGSNKIEIYGPEEVLNKIEYIPIYVSVKGLTENTTLNVNIDKPAGVRGLSITTTTISIKIVDAEQMTINDVGVIVNNLADGLAVTALDSSFNEGVKVSVLITGGKDALKQVDASKINALIDLSECTSPGEYEVPITVTGEDTKLIYKSQVTKIKVKITRKTS